MFAAARIDTTLFDALLEAREQHGGGHLIADDLEMQPLSYRGLVTGSFALGSVLARGTRPGERVGVLLPTSRASLVTFFALQAEGRVPAMLNFSTGPASAIAACRGAEITRIVTARRFIEKAKLQAAGRRARAARDDRLPRGHPRGDRDVHEAQGTGAIAAERRRATGPSAPTIRRSCSSRPDRRARRRAWSSATAICWPTGISCRRSSTSARRTSSSTRCRCFTASG